MSSPMVIVELSFQEIASSGRLLVRRDNQRTDGTGQAAKILGLSHGMVSRPAHCDERRMHLIGTRPQPAARRRQLTGGGSVPRFGTLEGSGASLPPDPNGQRWM